MTPKGPRLVSPDHPEFHQLQDGQKSIDDPFAVGSLAEKVCKSQLLFFRSTGP